MKRIFKVIISIILISASFTGCKKESGDTLSNPYTFTENDKADIYNDIPLTYVNGFSSNIAVIGENAGNSAGSEEISSESALLIDATIGDVLFHKNPFLKQYPASTTKILTALLAIKYGDASAERRVGDEVLINEYNALLCDFRQGVDVISFDIAIHGALMYSGNDAAAFLAMFAADSMSSFVDMMNEEAARLGATSSHFVNPHGLFDENHYSTAYDMYLIFNEAIKYSKFVDTISCRKYENTFTRTTGYGQYSISVSYSNTNKFVAGSIATPPGITVIGGKAGYTELARRSYVMLAEANGHRYIVITMRCDDNDAMYKDLTTLLKKIPVTANVYADNE